MQKENDYNNHNRTTMLRNLIPLMNIKIKEMENNMYYTSDNIQKLKQAFIDVLFSAGTQEDYQDYKNNY